MKKIDRIRNMNTAEFAYWLFTYANNPCNICDVSKKDTSQIALTNCLAKIMDWLNSDADDDILNMKKPNLIVYEYGFNTKSCFNVDTLVNSLKCMPLDAKVLFHEDSPISSYFPVNEVMIEVEDWHKDKIKKIVLSSNHELLKDAE